MSWDRAGGPGLRVVTLGRCPNSLLDRYHYPGRPAAAYWPSDWHLEGQDASRYGRLGLLDLHQQLAEVLALEQAKSRPCGCGLNALCE